MSSALAIATVTETLLHLLQQHIDTAHVPGATVTAMPPDSTGGLPDPGVNIFLYQVSPNAALRNADLPTRATNGSLLRRPQVALDLHYLLTFYGDESRLEQQRLLGSVALALHANPELPRALIDHVETTTSFLNGAGLSVQSELVRFVPVNFTLEELSKLWSFLLKIDYVLSTAYRASVVLIDGNDPLPPPPAPALSFNLQALPFREPLIQQILPAPGSGSLILPQSQIVLAGQNLSMSGSSTIVLFGTINQSPAFVSNTRIVVTLPGGLAAGPQTARVVQALKLGAPPTPHQAGIQSEIATFVLHPQIQPGAAPGSFAITARHNFGSPPEDVIEVKINPTVGAGQSAALQLAAVSLPEATHVFAAEPRAQDSDTVLFAVPGLPNGSYLARVLIDGAASPYSLDPSGAPVAPVIIW
ncbi:hypothetical protein XI09_05265 [Bradyrhizobium sp. CCBAU 11386]|uniref:DUF4255 domain-containing protein n=1 Tax=Bradyrhizobium sp. CCBAU 11386 TaxID=1630837 RepID=UPI0023035526|nr:DUF4255 domain-containing protein [Bradyrhizobium sp. CCBAU 11386]MDA9504181.1 hypothetical protein [Bradyrhizobium sp. CCBAU 11386]